MKTRSLGSLNVSALGLGCMGMTYAYGPADEAEALRVLRRYVELGGNFLDTAEVYGLYKNEELLGRFLREVPRGKIVIATKFGFRIAPESITGVNGSPENARRVCDASLKRLGTDYIDLYYQHRVDPAVAIEETVGAMAELVRAGKVRAIGLSEAAPETLRRATKIHPIAALQSEYSLWSRDVETNGVLAACRELRIGFVPYSPLFAVFLPAQFENRTTSIRATGDTQTRAFKAKPSRKTSRLRMKLKRWQRESGAPRRSWPWPGCLRKVKTSCRYRARSA